MLARQFLHALDGGAVGDRLGEIVPAGLLFGAEVRAVEDFLEAGDLRAALRRLGDVRFVLVHHRVLHFGQAIVRAGRRWTPELESSGRCDAHLFQSRDHRKRLVLFVA